MLIELKKRFVFFAAITTISLMMTYPALSAKNPPAQGETLPQFELAVPQDSAAKTYLGLSGSGKFTVPQIKARVVVIEIFSMY
ncbi:MAG: hypothetical protein PVF44_08765 [Syntrophobacterales bacterium]|jgi:hypothetical protein